MGKFDITIQPMGITVEYDTLTFSGGERHIQIINLGNQTIYGDDDNTLKIESDIISDITLDIRADIHSSDDIVDLLLLYSALSELINSGATLPVNLTIPYMPYARQDRVCAEGQAFGSAVFGEMLNQLWIRQLTTWDIHSKAALDSLHQNTHNITQVEMLKKSENWRFRDVFTDMIYPPVLICPDAGAVERTNNLRRLFKSYDLPMALCTKVRDPKTGYILTNEVDVNTDITNRTCIIADDICDGGMTFIKIAEKLKEMGCGKIILFVTHGIFSKGFEPFDGLIDEFWTTNSFGDRDTESVPIKMIKV